MKLITRTISENTYSVMCLDTNTAEVSVRDYSLGSAVYNTERKTLEALQAAYGSDTFKLVKIVSRSTRDALYCMTEAAFIAAAIRVTDVKEAREYFKSHPGEGEEVDVEGR